jgi:hypothetical protein
MIASVPVSKMTTLAEQWLTGMHDLFDFKIGMTNFRARFQQFRLAALYASSSLIIAAWRRRTDAISLIPALGLER